LHAPLRRPLLPPPFVFPTTALMPSPAFLLHELLAKL
jgi:hypothetical protein